jgi:hypothetical protein
MAFPLMPSKADISPSCFGIRWTLCFTKRMTTAQISQKGIRDHIFKALNGANRELIPIRLASNELY